ncbi:type I-E CRISPR-associated protein Cas5/CasD [Arenimonas composti]|uniref:CRISPR-associated protein Cas5 n=1 Tax=Arenimonas composti TR7-09 = DSM 18010 TaxID=1121013 RepID=A0A091BEM8_9GAMM|nr:type I-E CRISPR-associated protein Cas5/CasD [Arenimonas composti]KFN49274.1 hypothetical protein P873_11550 [Arenimonas composti TR7-09 = DSM 18010]
MNWLLFELAAPLASFGGVAPGTIRDTELLPTRSAVLGLLAAACGIERDDVDGQRRLGDGLLIAARVNADAALLRDFHSAQAPPEAALRGRPRRTRRDELAVAKDDLNAVLSDRYYYTTYAATVGIACEDGGRLATLEAALRRPRFVLYAGRKSCPLAWPLDPHQVEADDWAQALQLHEDRAIPRLAEFGRFGVDRWLRSRGGNYTHVGDAGEGEGKGVLPGELGGIAHVVVRRDVPVDTRRRLFKERPQWRIGRESKP